MTLDIEPYESTYYQFAYTPDPGGQGFTATATGDLDCDGNEVVYTVRGRAVAGDPTLEFENPTNRD